MGWGPWRMLLSRCQLPLAYVAGCVRNVREVRVWATRAASELRLCWERLVRRSTGGGFLAGVPSLRRAPCKDLVEGIVPRYICSLQNTSGAAKLYIGEQPFGTSLYRKPLNELEGIEDGV